MIATASSMPKRDFRYGRYRYVTWDATSHTDGDGNETIEFCYAEAPANCSDAEMRAVVLAELAKTGEEGRIDEIFELPLEVEDEID